MRFLVVLFHVSHVLAWSAAGHEIIATIAQIYLHPSVFNSLCHILNYPSNVHPFPSPSLIPSHTPSVVAPCHLASIATWADRVRFTKRWSAPLHYINALDDWPSARCAFPGARGWAGREGANIIGAIRNTTDILKEWVGGRSSGDIDVGRANEALKFLVHFLGDMHQPLHLVRRQNGGNGVNVTFGGRLTNFHKVWDTLIVAKALRSVPRNYSRPLPSRRIEDALQGTIYDAYVRRVVWEGLLGRWRGDVRAWKACPASVSASVPPASVPLASGLWETMLGVWKFLEGLGRQGSGGGRDEWDDDVACPFAWAEPIHRLNCEFVWPRALDAPPSLLGHLELDTPEYAGAIADAWVLEKLLAQAGVRLAGVINSLFADLGGEPEGSAGVVRT